jgi:hypothetical protein
VAIYRLLQEAAFGPEDVENLAAAYEDALRILGLKSRTDPLTELVAKRIIEVAQTGVRDPAKICALAIEGLYGPAPKP